MPTTNSEIGAFINAQAADASPDGAADYVLTYDASATAVKKVLLDDLPGAGGGSVATDTIWDAKGDLAVGTGANAASKLTVGANGTRPIAASGEATGIKWSFPPGYEFDYAEFTSDVSVTATSEGTADTVKAGNAVTYDGSTVILVEFQAAHARPNTGTTDYMVLVLLEDSTVKGQLGFVRNGGGGSPDHPVHCAMRLTPSAASHTYTVKAWVNSGTGTVGAGAGGTGAMVPGFLRVTKVS